MNKKINDIVFTPQGAVAEKVRKIISKKGLRPGDQLPTHVDLCRILGVGPRRLREGLSVLEHQGIIRTRSKAGTLVSKPSVEALVGPMNWHLEAVGYAPEDLLRTRACMEGAAAWEAAQRRRARDLLVILDALERLEARDAEAKSDLDEEEMFHLAVLKSANNPVMLTFGKLISAQIRLAPADLPAAPLRRKVNEEHRAIYQAIEHQDAPSAMNAMYRHVMAKLHPNGVDDQ